jgi:anaerobic selenocysteine-containing dehydrogenase
VRLPSAPGLDTYACIQAAHAGQLRMGVCLGGNLYGSNPDSHYAGAALSQLDMLVYLNTTLNTGHAHGLARETMVLPVLARDEEPQATTQESMFNYVRLSDGGPARHAGPRSEVEIVAQLAGAVLGVTGPIDWQAMRSTGRIREAIARVVPGFENIGRIDRSREEFHISGRTLHEPVFPTSDGKAHLHVHELPELSGGHGTLLLMTVRSEGQFNTVVYEDEDLYRGVDARDVILMHPRDMESLGLCENLRVTVRSTVGFLPEIRVIAYSRIKPGNALMYYPEANTVVPRVLDPASKTPAFKGAVVSIEWDGKDTKDNKDINDTKAGKGSV